MLTINKMRILFLLLSLISCPAFADSCGSYEYGGLTVQVIVIEEEIDGIPTAVSKNIWVTWKQSNETGTWLNDQIMAGTIRKSLKEYFEIQVIDEINVLNRLGAQGWEAFSHVASERAYPSSINEWYLKRCTSFTQ